MFKRIKLYWKNLKESQTMKEALIQKFLGVVVIVEANFRYFQDVMPSWSYGAALIMFGLLASYRRGKTTKPLSAK